MDGAGPVIKTTTTTWKRQGTNELHRDGDLPASIHEEVGEGWKSITQEWRQDGAQARDPKKGPHTINETRWDDGSWGRWGNWQAGAYSPPKRTERQWRPAPDHWKDDFFLALKDARGRVERSLEKELRIYDDGRKPLLMTTRSRMERGLPHRPNDLPSVETEWREIGGRGIIGREHQWHHNGERHRAHRPAVLDFQWKYDNPSDKHPYLAIREEWWQQGKPYQPTAHERLAWEGEKEALRRAMEHERLAHLEQAERRAVSPVPPASAVAKKPARDPFTQDKPAKPARVRSR